MTLLKMKLYIHPDDTSKFIAETFKLPSSVYHNFIENGYIDLFDLRCYGAVITPIVNDQKIKHEAGHVVTWDTKNVTISDVEGELLGVEKWNLPFTISPDQALELWKKYQNQSKG